MSPWLPALVILCLLFLTAFLSMVEISLVLGRESKLDADDDGGKEALELVRSPDASLSVIQTIVSFAAVLTGALAGGRFADPLADLLSNPVEHAEWAAILGRTLVVVLVAVMMLVFGQLVPKRIGLAHPETVLRITGNAVRIWTSILSPFAMVFNRTADGIVKLLQIKPAAAEAVSEDDVKMMVREGGKSGALLPEESEMVEAVLGLDRQRVRELMTPRGEIVWLDVAMAPEALFDLMLKSGRTRFPLHEGRRDNVIGVVSLRDVFTAQRDGGELNLRALAKPPLVVPPTQPVIKLLETFRSSGSTFALVADEFGGISGLITMQDAIEAIIGDFEASPDDEPTVVQRKDGSWLVDAGLNFDDVLDHFPDLPGENPEERTYVTLNGFILQRFNRIPTTGETFEAGPYRIEVLDLDRNRVDKILVTRLEEKVEEPAE